MWQLRWVPRITGHHQKLKAWKGPPRETSEGKGPLNLNFELLELWENKFLLLATEFVVLCCSSPGKWTYLPSPKLVYMVFVFWRFNEQQCWFLRQASWIVPTTFYLMGCTEFPEEYQQPKVKVSVYWAQWNSFKDGPERITMVFVTRGWELSLTQCTAVFLIRWKFPVQGKDHLGIPVKDVSSVKWGQQR